VSEGPTNGRRPLLEVSGLCAGYGQSQVLFDLSFTVPATGGLAVLGPNGAGKTTLAKTLLGYLRASSGTVRLDGEDVTAADTASLVRSGVGYVPQEQVVFPTLTVEENLILGGQAQRRGSSRLDEAYELFPKLAARRKQLAGTLSGGERKMVSVARALLGQPRLLVLDEPTEGVWHGVVDEIVARLRSYASEGSLLLIEQHTEVARELTERALVLQRGETAFYGATTDAGLHHDLARR
jgi:branched-chain amino acid transport system ATP-binding protein